MRNSFVYKPWIHYQCLKRFNAISLKFNLDHMGLAIELIFIIMLNKQICSTNQRIEK